MDFVSATEMIGTIKGDPQSKHLTPTTPKHKSFGQLCIFLMLQTFLSPSESCCVNNEPGTQYHNESAKD